MYINKINIRYKIEAGLIFYQKSNKISDLDLRYDNET